MDIKKYEHKIFLHIFLFSLSKNFNVENDTVAQFLKAKRTIFLKEKIAFLKESITFISFEMVYLLSRKG
jgi:hypothetical protein